MAALKIQIAFLSKQNKKLKEENKKLKEENKKLKEENENFKVFIEIFYLNSHIIRRVFQKQLRLKMNNAVSFLI